MYMHTLAIVCVKADNYSFPTWVLLHCCLRIKKNTLLLNQCLLNMQSIFLARLCTLTIHRIMTCVYSASSVIWTPLVWRLFGWVNSLDNWNYPKCKYQQVPLHHFCTSSISTSMNTVGVKKTSNIQVVIYKSPYKMATIL